MRAALRPVPLCVLLGSLMTVFLACKPEGGRQAPAAAATASQSNPYGNLYPPQGQGTVVPVSTNGAGAGVGCGSTDSVKIPAENEKALRGCCDQLMTANACQQSACWPQKVLTSVQSAMAAGGKCAGGEAVPPPAQ